MSTFAAFFALLVATPPADACPTIVTGTPSQLNFDSAQVAIVRQGTQTTFSVSINPFGEGQGFALVLPVPTVLEEAAIRTLNPTVFETLDGYSAPRHVADAGCVALNAAESDADTDADTDSDTDTDTSVDVEAEYLIGEYAITILSAEESGDLKNWLDAHGYYMPAGAEPRLAEYIDAGSYFMAAKVADTAAVADGSPLSPLQITYESEVFSIPIRLATLNSPGAQDMLIYAITDFDDGRVGISNYPEFEVPSTCIWGDPANEDFSDFYTDLYRKQWQAQDDAAWAVEFAGDMNDCSPCTGVTLSASQLEALGFTGGEWGHYLTRIHMRYTPEQAGEDISLYTSGMREPKTTSYADDLSINECIETCDDVLAAAAAESCGCSGGGGAAGFVVMGLVLGYRRRKVGDVRSMWTRASA